MKSSMSSQQNEDAYIYHVAQWIASLILLDLCQEGQGVRMLELDDGSIASRGSLLVAESPV